MAHKDKLPQELVEEILCRVPPESLVRLRAVSKQWNALLDDKPFIKNHKTSSRFILTTKSKIYSVSIDPKIEVCELTLNIPGLDSHIPKNLAECDTLLLCDIEKGVVDTPIRGSYNIVALCRRKNTTKKILWRIHDFASNAWKDLELESGSSSQGRGRNKARIVVHSTRCVSLNGNLYWITSQDKTGPMFKLYKFNTSSKKFFIFCDLPCGRTTDDPKDALVLRVVEGDRFSLLKQCHATKKIEVWVSKYEITNNSDHGDVEWIKFMEVSSPILWDLVDTRYSQPSYFIKDKRLVVCSWDEIGQPWIYVLAENKLISKTHIDCVVDPWPSHYTFIPSLVPVPRGQREDPSELQV